MTRPFDISKFRKTLTKAIPGMSTGYNDPTDWISTGNFALNYLISADFNKGIPLGKVSVFAGESGCLPKNALVRIEIPDFNKKRQTIDEVRVGELREMMKSNDYDVINIDTPDGLYRITEWFDKGKLPTVNISTANHQTNCATNHLMQLSNNEWVLAGDLKIGDSVITEDIIEDVTNISTGEMLDCYDFTVDHPNHRYWADGFSSHNSGKSFLCAGNIVRNAQKDGIYVVLIDSENALDESWLRALDVDTDESKLLKLNMAMIDDVALTISTFMDDLKNMVTEERPKVLFVIDSLGMLLTPTDIKQFQDGDLKGDMGRKPKALTALVRNCVNMFGAYNVGLVATNHTYASQNMFDPDDVISGGVGFIFASSIVVAMKKMKLKEDEDGNKIADVTGIRAGCKIMKTRYAKPFESIQLKIPYDTGMNEYSGLFDLFEKKKLFVKSGNSFIYTTKTGEELKAFRKKWEKNHEGYLDIVMDEVMLGNPVSAVIVDDGDQE